MKLEKGMYVRFLDGEIGKVANYEYEEEYVNGHTISLENDDISLCCEEKDFKARHNIIDLIEPLDLLFIDISPDDYGGIVVPRIAETLAELEIYKERIKSGEYILKGVLTREQIQSNIYKLDDSNA
jgi:hypothetical protein